ncbi:RNA-directed DNA polymerase from mobile element jockey-like [Brachionus plicatilis]|uniref:RNA-directed DNA polymerase from mobile element jockey-like n=1 Tax=Brachionus plicatilis TaxID=10195 RepID=A0A3M7SGD1_BRAPC|nr:RNA-directed DNA polymerase from mobile element jockey-like [Brachionus plicatilis]
MGDFNLPDIEWNEFGAPVLASDSSTSAYISSAIGYSSLEQLVTSKTFANSGNLSSLLDLVLVSDPNRMSEVELGPPLDTSVTRSHVSLRFRLFARVERTQAFDSRRYNWRNGDYESMNKFFKEFDWSAAFGTKSTQDRYTTFLGAFGLASERFVKKRWPRPLNVKPPWWNSRIAALVRRKRRLFICKSIEKSNEQLVNKHKTICKLVRVVVKKIVVEYELKLVQDAKKNPKLLYSYMNRRYATRETIAALKNQDGTFVTDRAGICIKLNQFFFSVFDPPTTREAVLRAKESFSVRAIPDSAFFVEDIVTPGKVMAKLKNLSSDKSAGIDQVATHALKISGQTLSVTYGSSEWLQRMYDLNMDRERKTEEESSKSWEQIKSMHHMKAKSLVFNLNKLTKIYKETLESAFSIAISKDEFVDRVKNVEDLKSGLNLKIKDLKSEEQIISSEDKDEELEYLKSKLYSLSTELEGKEHEINILTKEKQISIN